MRPVSRRKFLGNTLRGAAALGLGEAAILSQLGPVHAEEAKLQPDSVRFAPAIEPIVRLLEETPRNAVLEAVAARIKSGLSYQEVLAALFLAGIRNIQPRPNVGFKFHAVLVVNSAHLASLASPPAERWLPIFWAIDEFKSSQAKDVEEGDWTMRAVDQGAIPPAHLAAARFVEAMEAWDEASADVAAAGLARSAGINEIFELLFRFGARDFRSIGHKAIYVSNSFRTLQAIGQEHAEPVVRSLAYALLNHGEKSTPDKLDLEADRPWRRHDELLRRVRPDWLTGRADSGAGKEVLSTLRGGSWEDAGAAVVEALNAGVAPRAIYDSIFQAAAELVLRQPGLISLHATTTTNALHFAFSTAYGAPLRLKLLLQNAAFIPLFREAARQRSGAAPDRRIDALEPARLWKDESALRSPEAIHEVLAKIGKDPAEAAAAALGWLEGGGDPEALLDAARLLVFFKGNDAHDYKYSTAVLEDFHAVSPALRNRFLAAALPLLKSANASDQPMVARIRAALGT